MRHLYCVPIFLTLLAAPFAGTAQEESPPPPPACEDVEGFHRLDFWVGEWDVYVGSDLVGTNRIEKILNGCALMEHWSSARGGEGKSLFYYLPGSQEWKQVWVTARATAPGAVKEKRLTETLEDGSVRFQGELPRRDGSGTYFDRTTLTPLDGGHVRQVIEVSGDGTEWRKVWDSVYVPKGSKPPQPTEKASEAENAGG